MTEQQQRLRGSESDSSDVQLSPAKSSSSWLRQFLNVPNLVTLFRMLVGLAAAALVYAVGVPYRFGVAAGMLTFATVMDLFDGFLARRLGSVTRLGAVLDPLADKIVANVFFCVLVNIGVFEWWFVGLALVRDLTVQGGRIWAASGGLAIRTFRVSDTRNFIQITAVLVGLLSQAPPIGYLSTLSTNISLADTARILFAVGLVLGYIGLVAFFVTFWRASQNKE